MTLDMDGLEHAVVRHCAPALAGIKPACLFNVPGAFAADANEEPAARLDSWRRARALNARLDALVTRTNALLSPAAIHMRVMARRHCGALVLVYRPALLSQALAAPRVSARLREWGYVTSGAGWLEAALDRLGKELERRSGCGPDVAFPHEVGFFLGYPYEDVMGFIEHEGRDCLCCGCWKVYAHKEQALALFERYRQCTRDFEALLSQGMGLADLVGMRVAA